MKNSFSRIDELQVGRRVVIYENGIEYMCKVRSFAVGGGVWIKKEVSPGVETYFRLSGNCTVWFPDGNESIPIVSGLMDQSGGVEAIKEWVPGST